MTGARSPLQRVVVAGDGQLGVLTAIGIRRALPHCAIMVLGTPPNPAAFADNAATALPFSNRLHDRLGVSEDDIVARAGGSHRLMTRYFGFGTNLPDGSQQHGALPYGASIDPALKTAFAKEWGGGPRNAVGATAQTEVPGSLAEVLAEAGRFCPPPGTPDSPLAELDYALRWNSPAYRQMLITLAARMGIEHQPGTIGGIRLDDAGKVAALQLDDGQELAADMFFDCSGPEAHIHGRMPETDRVDWSEMLPVRNLFIGKPGEPMLALEDRISLLKQGWLSELAGRDGLQAVLGSPDGVAESEVIQALGTEPISALTISPGRTTRPWSGNVVALGDAAAQFEPLAGLNLDFAHRQLDLLLEMLPGQDCTPLETAEFNRRANMMADRVRDTLALHYASPGAAKLFGKIAMSSEVTLLIDQFTRRGRTPFFEEAPLLGQEFSALLLALGYPRGEGALARSEQPNAARTAQNQFAAQAQAALAAAPPYNEWMSSILRRAQN